MNLEEELLGILGKHVVGADHGAVGTLERIIKEREDGRQLLRAKMEEEAHRANEATGKIKQWQVLLEDGEVVTVKAHDVRVENGGTLAFYHSQALSIEGAPRGIQSFDYTLIFAVPPGYQHVFLIEEPDGATVEWAK